MSRKLAIFAALAMVLATAAGALGAPEFEPNNVRTQADVIGGYPCYEPGTGSIGVAGDVDYWIVATPKGSRLWALVDGQGANSLDPELRAESLGGSLIEADDDDGTATGGDTSVESAFAPLIAGRDVGGVRRTFLRVFEHGSDWKIDSYTLLTTVTKGSVAEIEPNDAAAAADFALRCPHVRSGAISPAGDNDWFAFTTTGPRAMFFALDADPGRTSPLDLELTLVAPDGVTPLVLADSSGASAGAAEGFRFDVPSAGTYFVRVNENGDDAAGDYRLLISGLPKIKCNKKYATMTGSPAADLIQGTDGGDVIASFGGADRVFGGRGHDRECGGGGPDRLYGGRGLDRLYGGGAGDKLIGGKDEDVCVGGPGSDTTKSC